LYTLPYNVLSFLCFVSIVLYCFEEGQSISIKQIFDVAVLPKYLGKIFLHRFKIIAVRDLVGFIHNLHTKH